MLNVEKFSHGKLDWNGHVSSAHHGPDITVLPLLTRRPWKPLKRDKNKHMEIYEVECVSSIYDAGDTRYWQIRIEGDSGTAVDWRCGA